MNIVVEAVLAMWLWGFVSVPIIAAIFISPLQRLADVLKTNDDSVQRRKNLSELRQRRDEISEAAIAVGQIDEDRAKTRANAAQREQQAQESTRQLSAVLQAMVEGVLAVDGTERLMFANTAACTMLEMPPENLQGRLVYDCVRSSNVQEAVREAVGQRAIVNIECRLPRNDALVKLVASPLAGGGAVVVLEDVTEVRKLETMRQDFVNGISHELKTPLTVIQACTETLLDEANDDIDASKRFLGQIQQQAERLLQMILGMLQLARVESGEQVLDKEPVDLFGIARDVVAEMKPVAEGTQRTLQLLGESELFVLGDYQAIRTVIGNLVDNALKYTTEGGNVSVTLAVEDTANLVQISDNGIGIPVEDQNRVFERFFRVQRDRNRDRGGTGLGLAIVKHLCEAMGAEIKLTSDHGKGSKFEIRFAFND